MSHAILLTEMWRGIAFFLIFYGVPVLELGSGIPRMDISVSGLLEKMPLGLPLKGRISSAFGWRRDPLTGRRRFHSGIDIAMGFGHPIRATAGGFISFAGNQRGYGKMVRIDHKNGFETIYTHIRGLSVGKGRKVKRGDLIGWVGSSGRSTGPHLHYEVLFHGTPYDPNRVALLTTELNLPDS